ncbi:unnamed protein product [Cuscuta epithymum]|uniref:Uncharacterized protein n=1 Tax=Cuscuta epithymum TaxID=186058 RepID=A0AAV0DTX1_9ASTE|nr:unnamed protein product [Cuscuta epithymum]CAH9129349.1 unnamed protein product [Cuscuta epithymum]
MSFTHSTQTIHGKNLVFLHRLPVSSILGASSRASVSVEVSCPDDKLDYMSILFIYRAEMICEEQFATNRRSYLYWCCEGVMQGKCEPVGFHTAQ